MDPHAIVSRSTQRDAVVVAEHARGAAARWRAHALIDLENDRLWYERMRDAYLARLAERS